MLNVIKRIFKFYKLANDSNSASLAVEKLKNDKFFDSSLWFTKDPAISNAAKNFNLIDKKLKQKVKSSGFDYIESREYSELKEYILSSFDKHFKRFKLRSLDVESLLSDQEQEDLFILMHDLIHQVFQKDFTQAIQSQSVDLDDDPGYYIPLMDRLYEDAASSLSNFRPKKSSQGLFEYLERLFQINVPDYEESEEGLKELINNVFNIAKQELRKNGDNKFKQFADGFLSKLKGQMLDRDNLLEALHLAQNDFGDIWKHYNLQELYEPEYYERLNDHDLLDEEKAVVLRNWLMGCINKAKEVLNKDYDEYNDEEEDN